MDAMLNSPEFETACAGVVELSDLTPEGACCTVFKSVGMDCINTLIANPPSDATQEDMCAPASLWAAARVVAFRPIRFGKKTSVHGCECDCRALTIVALEACGIKTDNGPATNPTSPAHDTNDTQVPCWCTEGSAPPAAAGAILLTIWALAAARSAHHAMMA